MNDNEQTPGKRKKVNYINNKDLLIEIGKSKEQGAMTPKLAKMLQMLAARYGKKGNFANYTYNEDMQAYAMLMLVKTWNSFDLEKGKNPFAFFTQCIKNSFIQYLNNERKERNVRDALLVDSGLSPSFTYQMEHEERNRVLYEERYDAEPVSSDFEYSNIERSSGYGSVADIPEVDDKERVEPSETDNNDILSY